MRHARRWILIPILAAALLLAAGPDRVEAAPDAVRIQGVVTDADGAPRVGVVVRAWFLPYLREHQARTDRQG